MQDCKSSMFKQFHHDEATNGLELHMHNGSVYHVMGMKPEDVEAFKTSASMGKHFNTVIKTNPAFTITKK